MHLVTMTLIQAVRYRQFRPKLIFVFFCSIENTRLDGRMASCSRESKRKCKMIQTQLRSDLEGKLSENKSLKSTTQEKQLFCVQIQRLCARPKQENSDHGELYLCRQVGSKRRKGKLSPPGISSLEWWPILQTLYDHKLLGQVSVSLT